jgi:two-component system, NarL family, nitrate/nitrite response regulator NarL
VGRNPLEQPVRVVIIDDHPVVIEGVRSWLLGDARLEIAATGDDLDGVLENAGDVVDVILLDLNLRGQFVVDRIGELCAAGRRVVVYSQHRDEQLVLSVLEAGAFAFLSKDEGREHCVATVLAAAADRPYVAPTLAGAMVGDQAPQRPALSDKEREALLLWFQSMNKASVARRMGISEHTVKQYVDRARVKYAKVGRPAPTKSALLARAIEDQLLRADEIGDYRSHASLNQGDFD